MSAGFFMERTTMNNPSALNCQARQVDYNKEKMSTDEIERFWSSVKGKAIARECNKFYSQYEGCLGARQLYAEVFSFG